MCPRIRGRFPNVCKRGRDPCSRRGGRGTGCARLNLGPGRGRHRLARAAVALRREQEKSPIALGFQTAPLICQMANRGGRTQLLSSPGFKDRRSGSQLRPTSLRPAAQHASSRARSEERARRRISGPLDGRSACMSAWGVAAVAERGKRAAVTDTEPAKGIPRVTPRPSSVSECLMARAVRCNYGAWISPTTG